MVEPSTATLFSDKTKTLRRVFGGNEKFGTFQISVGNKCPSSSPGHVTISELLMYLYRHYLNTTTSVGLVNVISQWISVKLCFQCAGIDTVQGNGMKSIVHMSSSSVTIRTTFIRDQDKPHNTLWHLLDHLLPAVPFTSFGLGLASIVKLIRHGVGWQGNVVVCMLRQNRPRQTLVVHKNPSWFLVVGGKYTRR